MKNYKFLQEIVSEILKKQLFYNVRCTNVRNTQKNIPCKRSQHTENAHYANIRSTQK